MIASVRRSAPTGTPHVCHFASGRVRLGKSSANEQQEQDHEAHGRRKQGPQDARAEHCHDREYHEDAECSGHASIIGTHAPSAMCGMDISIFARLTISSGEFDITTVLLTCRRWQSPARNGGIRHVRNHLDRSRYGPRTPSRHRAPTRAHATPWPSHRFPVNPGRRGAQMSPASRHVLEMTTFAANGTPIASPDLSPAELALFCRLFDVTTSTRPAWLASFLPLASCFGWLALAAFSVGFR